MQFQLYSKGTKIENCEFWVAWPASICAQLIHIYIVNLDVMLFRLSLDIIIILLDIHW